MDFSKLKTTDWLVGGGAVVFLISMFLPWYKAEFDGGFGVGGSVAVNGFHYVLFGYLPLLLIVAVFVNTVLPALTEVNLPETYGPMPRKQAALVAAAVAAALVILRLILKDDAGNVELFTGIEVKRGFGLFIATLASIAVVVGALMKFQGTEDIGSIQKPGSSGPGTTPPTPF